MFIQVAERSFGMLPVGDSVRSRDRDKGHPRRHPPRGTQLIRPSRKKKKKKNTVGTDGRRKYYRTAAVIILRPFSNLTCSKNNAGTHLLGILRVLTNKNSRARRLQAQKSRESSRVESSRVESSQVESSQVESLGEAAVSQTQRKGAKTYRCAR